MTEPSKQWQIEFSLNRLRRRIARLDAEAADRDTDVDRKRREREEIRHIDIPPPPEQSTDE